MTPLAIAIERGQWEVVAYRLLLGVSEAAHRLPPEALSELIDLLAAVEAPATVARGPGRPFRGAPGSIPSFSADHRSGR